MKAEYLRYGAAYYSEYLPYDRVEQDMEMMERAGMNTIRIAESTWSTLEPREGVFDFSHIDRVLAAAEKHHISVIVGTPTYAIPAWLAKKHPDILAVTHNGRERYGHRQNMDITHPEYLRHAELVIRALMEHIKEVPHIIGFQLDNETKSYDTSGEHVQAMFVEYLKERFPDIERFNLAFGLDYWSNRINCWEDFPDVRGTINQSLAAEFKKFQRLFVTRFLKWQADLVNEYKRPEQFITQNFDLDWNGHSFGYQSEVNQYEAAECMTKAGCDIYHPSQDGLTGAEITFCGAIARSLKKDNYFVLETQAQGNIDWLPYPGQLRLQAYSHIANGADSVIYWHWHSIHNAEESYWKGVLSHDFSENEIYREACVIGSEWKKIGTRLVHLKKQPAVAIMLDNNSLTGLKLFPFRDHKADSYNTVARWLGDTLYRLNIEYDMISSNERRFQDYPCLIVPALYSASEDLLTALSDYVKEGGHLITTFRTGFADEHLKIYADRQPHILHECLGLHYDMFTVPKEVEIRKTVANRVINTKNKYEVTAVMLSGPAQSWMDLVVCDDAVRLLSYKHPVWEKYAAAAMHEFGKGTALYLGTMFDASILEQVILEYFELVPSLSKLIGEETPAFPIILKKGINRFHKEIFFYLNYSSDSQRTEHRKGDCTDLLTGECFRNGDVLRLDPWGVKILERLDSIA